MDAVAALMTESVGIPPYPGRPNGGGVGAPDWRASRTVTDGSSENRGGRPSTVARRVAN